MPSGQPVLLVMVNKTPMLQYDSVENPMPLLFIL
jgi:hypothetical protein